MTTDDLFFKSANAESLDNMIDELWKLGYHVHIRSNGYDGGYKVEVDRWMTEEERDGHAMPWLTKRHGRIQSVHTSKEAKVEGIKMAIGLLNDMGPVKPWTPTEDTMRGYIKKEAEKLAKEKSEA